MPGKDQTRPVGQSPARDEGKGHGSKHGFGRGPSENCVCPSCGEVVHHKLGQSCRETKCPSCGTPMTRE